MIYIVLNVLPILLATCAGVAFGAIYYGIAGAIGAHATKSIAGRSSILLAIFVCEFWLACILAGALILAPPQASVWTMSIGSAVIIWVGFVVPVIVATYQVRGIALRSAAVDCAHWLIVMLLQAVVLRAIGLMPAPA